VIGIVVACYVATYGGWVPALIASVAWLIAGICRGFAKSVAKFFMRGVEMRIRLINNGVHKA
jgi:hypothetical protein